MQAHHFVYRNDVFIDIIIILKMPINFFVILLIFFYFNLSYKVIILLRVLFLFLTICINRYIIALIKDCYRGTLLWVLKICFLLKDKKR